MGSALPRFARAVKKPLETRITVDKMLEGKPSVAPRHPSTQSAMDKLSASKKSARKMSSLLHIYS